MAVNGDTHAATGGSGGRSVSMQRRRALSAGKAALPARPAAAAAPDAPATARPSTGDGEPVREVARARRAEMCRTGRGDAPPAGPVRPPRAGTLDYAPKVVVSQTQRGGHVTGIRIGNGRNVTGDVRGTTLPISGTQYIGADSGAGWRAGGPKVGQARTAGGVTVSGTLVRSNVAITGDEAGSSVVITGEADGRIDDDVTQRTHDGAAGAQFGRPAAPNARAMHANLGRSAQSFGSRRRSRDMAIESTQAGLPVTGSAVGRSIRVTGDEPGACLAITGDQYLAPAQRSAACGGSGGGTAPAHAAAGRPDPVSGSKVAASQTWRGRRVTGIDVEAHPRVTGSASGACAAVTGSSYQGADTTYAWCDDTAVDAVEARVLPRPPAALVTGDTPLHDAAVTGTARGAGRDITGTPYYRDAPPTEALPAAPVARIDERFSVRSPQRSAQLLSERVERPADVAEKITGSFAVGHGKVTGNLEFTFTPRRAPDGEAARLRITGEGRSSGPAISGAAWKAQSNVTGTEGAFAVERNPSERGSKPRAFAGAGRFKALASQEEPKHLVTGMFGYASDNAAKVTLSGGAQG